VAKTRRNALAGCKYLIVGQNVFSECNRENHEIWTGKETAQPTNEADSLCSTLILSLYSDPLLVFYGMKISELRKMTAFRSGFLEPAAGKHTFFRI
jgi:hypothetical protein